MVLLVLMCWFFMWMVWKILGVSLLVLFMVFSV